MTPLTEAEFAAALATFERTAFRLELQPVYLEPGEAEAVRQFFSGHPQKPTESAALKAWYDQVQRQTASGKLIERVRVHEDPPTAYQQWEHWIGAWNTAAGERLSYLTRQRAREIGLLPAAGNTDWWLLDDHRLIVMNFDDDGRRISTNITDDPNLVKQAQAWRDLAVQHGIPDHPEDTVPA